MPEAIAQFIKPKKAPALPKVGAGSTVMTQQNQPYTLQGASSGGKAFTPQISATLPQNGILQGPSATGANVNVTQNPVQNQQPVNQQGMGSPLTSSPSPWLSSSYEFNKEYVPTSTNDPIFGSNTLTEQQKALAMQNYLRKGGLDTGKNIAQTPEEEIKNLLEGQKADKSFLDQQIAAGLKKNKSQLEANTGGINATIGAVSREGATSQGNQLAAQQVVGGMNAEFDQLSRQYAEQQRKLDEAQQAGNWDAVATYSKDVASTQQALAEAQAKNTETAQSWLKTLSDTGALQGLDENQLQAVSQQLGGLPTEVLNAISQSQTQQYQGEAQKQQQTQQTTTLDNFKQLAAQGVQLSPQFIAQQAEQSGIPMEQLVAYNTAVDTINADKSLDQMSKQQAIEAEGFKLSQFQKGIFNQTQENISYLADMYKQGASSEMIAAFKSAAGITDQNDPLYKADVAYKQAQARIESRHANGEAVTIEDQVNLMNARRQMMEFDAEYGGGYLPTAPLEGLQTSLEDGQLSVTCPPGSSYQCGEFVNRVWGLSSGGSGGFGNSYASKQAIVDKTGILSTEITDSSQVVPGMAFVMPIGGKYTNIGHVGLVKSAPDAEGNFYTVEANANGDEKVTEKLRNINQVYGFAPPPKGKSEAVGFKDNYAKYFNEARAAGRNAKDAKAFANDRVKEDLANQPTDSGGGYSKDQQATIKDLYGRYDATTQEIRALEQGNAFVKTFNPETAKSADDIALIYAFNKVMDPRSVVREGEFTIASSVGGLLDQMGASVENVKGGGRLLPAQRQQILDTMKRSYEAKRTEYDPILENAIQAGAKLGIDDPSLYLDYMPKSKEEQVSKPNWLEGLMNYHQETGKYIVPEDHPINNYEF